MATQDRGIRLWGGGLNLRRCQGGVNDGVGKGLKLRPLLQNRQSHGLAWLTLLSKSASGGGCVFVLESKSLVALMTPSGSWRIIVSDVGVLNICGRSLGGKL